MFILSRLRDKEILVFFIKCVSFWRYYRVSWGYCLSQKSTALYFSFTVNLLKDLILDYSSPPSTLPHTIFKVKRTGGGAPGRQELHIFSTVAVMTSLPLPSTQLLPVCVPQSPTSLLLPQMQRAGLIAGDGSARDRLIRRRVLLNAASAQITWLSGFHVQLRFLYC